MERRRERKYTAVARQLVMIFTPALVLAVIIVACCLGGNPSQTKDAVDVDYGTLVADYQLALNAMINIVEHANSDATYSRKAVRRYYDQLSDRLNALAELRGQLPNACRQVTNGRSPSTTENMDAAWRCPMQESDIDHLRADEAKARDELQSYLQLCGAPSDPQVCQQERLPHAARLMELLLHLDNYCDCMMSGFGGSDESCCRNGFDDSGFCERDDDSFDQ